MSDAPRLPVKIDSTSNGEFLPTRPPAWLTHAKKIARARLADAAKRANVSRRAFFAGVCGTAGTLLTFNQAFAHAGKNGGRFVFDKEAPFDAAAAGERLRTGEFVFDVHTHMVNPAGEWRSNHGKYWERALASFPTAQSCSLEDKIDCYAAERFLEDVFVDSDTDAAVLTFVPETPTGNPLDLKEADRTRRLVEALGDGRHRLLLHAMVIPNSSDAAGELARMGEVVDDWEIAAWKCYTQWGPDGAGWRLDDPETGIPFIERARELGVKLICIHKGLMFPGMPPEFGRCDDVGAVAARYPDMKFLIYHSGFEIGRSEGVYDVDAADGGVDSLVRTLQTHGIAPNANVYADLGATWWFLMRDPDSAAHTLGKLIKHVGEDNVLWGTDSIWFGSPQDQIDAFRAFEISDELIETQGYTPLSPSVKEKIFGLNGARVYGLDPKQIRKKAENDSIARRRRAGLERGRLPHFETFGPKTMREYDKLTKRRGGVPA